MTQSLSEASLHDAALTGDVIGVRAALIAGADIDFRNGVADTALDLAIRKGHETVVLALIGAGANVSGGDSRASLLTSAIAAGHENIARMLVAAGACDKPSESSDDFARDRNHDGR